MLRRLIALAAPLAALVALAGCGSSSGGSSSTAASSAAATTAAPASAQPGPEGAPLESGALLGKDLPTTSAKTVDGIKCDTSEQVAQHIHAHLQVYVNGKPRALPIGIGILDAAEQQTQYGRFAGAGSAKSCFYWLHTHARDGIVHVESPTQKTFSLGQFFAVWGQPLSPSQVAGAHGAVTAYVDGQKFVGNPQLIALTAHASIELDVGTPLVKPQTATFGPDL